MFSYKFRNLVNSTNNSINSYYMQYENDTIQFKTFGIKEYLPNA